MEVQFRRVGKRRYAVSVVRSGRPTLEMNPAPGYDDLMPHDLLHFVVERELGLERGLYGQLAAGGTAGTFHPVTTELNHRERSRLARDVIRRGAKLLRDGREDCELSERAAHECFQEWSARGRSRVATRDDPGTRARARRPSASAVGAGALATRDQLDRICAELDELSAAWVRLGIGEALSVAWPERARRLDAPRVAKRPYPTSSTSSARRR